MLRVRPNFLTELIGRAPDDTNTVKRKAEEAPAEEPVAKVARVEDAVPRYHYFVTVSEGNTHPEGCRFLVGSTPKSAFILDELAKLEGEALNDTIGAFTAGVMPGNKFWCYEAMPPHLSQLSLEERGMWEEVRDFMGGTVGGRVTFYASDF